MNVSNLRRIITSKFGSAEPPKLVYYFVKFIGLAPFTLKNNRFHPPTKRGLLYPVAIAVAYLLPYIITFSFGIFRAAIMPDSRAISNWALIQYTSCLPATYSVITVSLLSHKKIIRFMNELCEWSSKLVTLGVKEDIRKMLKNVVMTIVVANGIAIPLCVTLCLLEPSWNILSTISYALGTWFSLNMLLIYDQVLFCIRKRFSLLNEKLSVIFVRPREVGASRNPDTSATAEDEAGSGGDTQLQLIREIEGLRLELSNLVDQTAGIFALPILLASFQIFSEIVVCGNFLRYIFRMWTLAHCGHGTFTSVVVPNIWCPVLKMVIVTLEILIVARVSAATAKEGNSTRNVLNRIWLDSKNEPAAEFDDEFFMFSVQLADKPIAVSAFGIFNLDYSFLYKMFSAVVTYTIVLIQLHNDKIYDAVRKMFEAKGCVSVK